MRSYRVTQAAGVQSHGHKSYKLGLPWQIAESIPAGTEFTAHLTEEGVLYRPVLIEDTQPVEVPSWIARVGGSS
jgi:hypothetical protein